MTETLAQLMGPYLLLTGIGIFVSEPFYLKMIESGRDLSPVLVNLSGAVHFIAGMLVLTQHFRWSGLTEVAVSAVGCAAVLKGAALIVFPERALRDWIPKPKQIQLAATLFTVLGLALCQVGFDL